MNAITIEIESDDGEPIDIDALCADLLAMGLKVRRTTNGFHILSAIVLRAAQDSIINAISIALPGEEGEAPEPEVEPPKWDDAITWDSSGGECIIPLPRGIAWDLNAGRTAEAGPCEGQRRVYACAPSLDDPWVVGYCSPGMTECTVDAIAAGAPTMALRFGWAPPGTIEPMSDERVWFDG